MAIASSITTGVFSTAPTPRIATCGWLITGVANTLPKLPKLVMENVPPGTSSGFSWRERARAARSTIERCKPDHVLLVGVADHRHDQARAAVERHRDAEVDLVVIDDVRAVDRGVDDRERAQRFGRGAGDERQEGQREAVAAPGTAPSACRGSWRPWSCRPCEPW